jgi:hypothetical protein
LAALAVTNNFWCVNPQEANADFRTILGNGDHRVAVHDPFNGGRFDSGRGTDQKGEKKQDRPAPSD